MVLYLNSNGFVSSGLRVEGDFTFRPERRHLYFDKSRQLEFGCPLEVTIHGKSPSPRQALRALQLPNVFPVFHDDSVLEPVESIWFEWLNPIVYGKDERDWFEWAVGWEDDVLKDVKKMTSFFYESGFKRLNHLKVYSSALFKQVPGFDLVVDVNALFFNATTQASYRAELESVDDAFDKAEKKLFVQHSIETYPVVVGRVLLSFSME